MENIEYHRLAASEDDGSVPKETKISPWIGRKSKWKKCFRKISYYRRSKLNSFMTLLCVVTFCCCCLVALVLAIVFSGKSKSATYDETPWFRPQYHYTPKKNWMNDPNGLIYHNGEYELYFQYNPYGSHWGHMSWGHAKSKDMVHWEQQPVALMEADGVMIFSGSAVVDTNNTSGFGNKTHPPLVALYTGFVESDKIQDQRVAYSNDNGMSWINYENNPVLDRHSENFRDPKVFWHPPTKSWCMLAVLAQKHTILFYTSVNLIDWTLASEFIPSPSTGVSIEGNWECPDLFPLKVIGAANQIKWILKVDTSGNRTEMSRTGAQYFIGEFNGTHFVAAGKSQWLDSGMDFYASNTWNNRYSHDGRMIIIGWACNWYYSENIPTSPFRGMMSIPRVLSLLPYGDGLRLAQQPIQELQSLRGDPITFAPNPVVTADGYAVQFNTNHVRSLEIFLNVTVLSRDKLKEFGLKLMKGPSQELVIGWRSDDQSFFINRTASGIVDMAPHFPVVNCTQVPLNQDGRMWAQIFLDWCSVEVFVNGGVVTFTDLFFPDTNQDIMEFYWTGAKDAITYDLGGYEMTSIWKKAKN
ncbi:uncharacterized protein LOC106151601 isoform X1 [Lingula anatina]|uniref:Uncharacterized protein LOC106151601 isoform X1 n=1 Tax=Lingula anatina TaxID=7574 RepID=A0A1S3H5I4_LINAN|nr:uncharacterized protein LOC106151601 isoform X1 [Lingula anatina]|eukprot:XP_013380394.1 uncharacterized protein LOC106151601 isoform X1 [Lingula anatina]